MNLKLLFVFVILSLSALSYSQYHQEIQSVYTELEALDSKRELLLNKIENLKLKKIIADLKEVGLPSKSYISHSAMILHYNEDHEQANWVSHMILPDIKFGNKFRTNDFRVDPKVKSGTAVQEDYFLTDTLSNGIVQYDGYGYDRGHLAPSADFNWSSKAISESYFYSNMSPQLPEFNQRKWAELEEFLRGYVIRNNVPLYVMTAPVLDQNLPVVDRATNHLTIPNQYIKVAYDKKNDLGIAFLMENKNLQEPLQSYAISIDEAEEILGLDFFNNIDQDFESDFDNESWFDEIVLGDVEPIHQKTMPRYHFNSIVGGQKLGQKVTVCGKVVSTKYSRKGNLWLNLDKSYPNHIFSVFVKKDDLANFSYDPKLYLENHEVCFNGEVDNFNDVPTIHISNPKKVYFYEKQKVKN